MTKAILRYFITVILVAVTLCASLSTILIYRDNLETIEHDMLYSLKLIDYSLDYTEELTTQIDEMNPLAYGDNTRITVIDDEGNVLSDTYGDVLENHYDREEIQEALKIGEGYAQRKSETTNENTLYVAYYSNHHVIRLSIPYNAMTDYIQTMIPVLSISIIVSFVIAYMLSRKLAFNVSKPIIEIGEGIDKMSEDFRFDLKEYKYEEFNTIVDTIHNLSHRLRKSMREVQYERIKVNEILRSMNEGFVLLDDQNIVMSINHKAIEILGNVQMNENILNYIYMKELLEALESNASEQYIEIKVNHNIYGCYISRTSLGTTLFFADITDSKRAEKMRSEFFSNVSHELKTPMTSIKGYSELLAQGFVADEKQRNMMIEKIGNEVNNMSRLINDILMLSRLENMDVKTEMMPIKMKGIVLEVLESYEALAKKNHITIHIDFKEVDYIGNHQQMFTLLSNLIGNAIKYNKENGDVWVDIQPEEGAIRLTVKDNGIGIPKADQSRIFERFYRVDKGRSRQLGGTGLGLAIVKHMVNSYKGTIHLTSELDIGTTIEVVLPEQKRTA